MKQNQNYLLSNTVALIGLMGAGKTTLGRYFAKSLLVDFVDSDDEIVKRAGISIPDIFELSGEQKFRDIEQRVIADILQGSPVILSTGGGAFISPKTREILSNKSVTIWLRAKPETLLSRIDNLHNRPLLAKGDPLLTLTKLANERERYYKRADVIIDTNNLSAKRALRELIFALQERDVLKLEESVPKE
tara:strand:- start:38 stop:607 length:570 start_codon:yes stop_codon:yes gene_type:complete